MEIEMLLDGIENDGLEAILPTQNLPELVRALKPTVDLEETYRKFLESRQATDYRYDGITKTTPINVMFDYKHERRETHTVVTFLPLEGNSLRKKSLEVIRTIEEKLRPYATDPDATVTQVQPSIF